VVAFDPGVFAALALAELLYLRAVRILRRRGYEVPAGQLVLWHVGWAIDVVALLGPLDVLAQKLMLSHMAQHQLIAEIAAPLLLAGLRTPVLFFFPPRSVLVFLARRHLLRRAFRRLRQPTVAIPLYVANLWGWHFRLAFIGALRHPAIHALQHLSFVVASALVWWAVIAPQQRPLRGELWKIPQIAGPRLAGMLLGAAFMVMQTPAYHAFYGESARAYGLSPLADQQIAGGMMFGVDVAIIAFVLTYFFFKSAADADRDEAREREAAAALYTPDMRVRMRA
jgi:putative membrane protein